MFLKEYVSAVAQGFPLLYVRATPTSSETEMHCCNCPQADAREKGGRLHAGEHLRQLQGDLGPLGPQGLSKSERILRGPALSAPCSS